jgi:HAD superfamily hydrolase (TIGR01549 family)
MRAVIFDFDGTLADSFSSVIAIAYKLTKREQLADLNHVQTMRNANVGLIQAVRLLKIPKWQWPWLLQRGRQYMAREIHKIPLFPGIEEVLARLKRENYEMYIITSNSAANVDRFLTEKGLLPYFKKVYGGSGLFDKAKILKKVMKEQGLDPSSTVYVGDEVRDIEATKKLNMPCIAVAWGYNSEDLLLQHSPMVIARSPKQLENIIVEWGNTL